MVNKIKKRNRNQKYADLDLEIAKLMGSETQAREALERQYVLGLEDGYMDGYRDGLQDGWSHGFDAGIEELWR